jgi:hypothetical protein
MGQEDLEDLLVALLERVLEDRQRPRQTPVLLHFILVLLVCLWESDEPTMEHEGSHLHSLFQLLDTFLLGFASERRGGG